jgi:H+-translocating NAD(P) transhydrogenase subunit alpha
MEQIANSIIGALPMIYMVVLATFVGMEVINNIPSILHTPLMSGSNAISGVVVMGGIVAVLSADPSSNHYVLVLILGALAIFLAMLNVVGGFMVTDRMLAMFKKKK